MTRAHNFSAGPAALPVAVLEQAQQDLVDFRGAGMSLMEMSHRGAIYGEIHNAAIADLRALLSIPEGHRVLFMGGGARSQFAIVPMNLLGDGEAAYINTGTWSTGALQEARKFGRAAELWTGAESTFDRVPSDGECTPAEGAAYLHYTSNNTIYGTQFASPPDPAGAPLICDMSSDILSRKVDVSRFGLIYAGAQKNMGPAGVTLVIVREDLLDRCGDHLPEVMHYRKVAAKNSMLNTPPTFPIYMVGLVARHLLERGGLDATSATNDHKAELLYRTIDESAGFWRGHARPKSRSRMNVTFRLPTPELDALFVAEATEAGLSGLKGHRSVGGLRASIYNAVPLASVRALVDFMGAFKARHG